jgi:hypothetical protein
MCITQASFSWKQSRSLLIYRVLDVFNFHYLEKVTCPRASRFLCGLSGYSTSHCFSGKMCQALLTYYYSPRQHPRLSLEVGSWRYTLDGLSTFITTLLTHAQLYNGRCLGQVLCDAVAADCITLVWNHESIPSLGSRQQPSLRLVSLEIHRLPA